MPRRQRLKLNERDEIVATRAENHSGPGWSNQTVRVFVVDYLTQKLRSECIQGRDFDRNIRALFDVCVAADKAMAAAVERFVVRKEDASCR